MYSLDNPPAFPPPKCTVACEGDLHVGNNLPDTRYWRILYSNNRDAPCCEIPAMNFSVGDLQDANDGDAANDIKTTQEQDIVVKRYVSQFKIRLPDGSITTFRGYKAITGNHDPQKRPSPDGTISPDEAVRVAQWAVDYSDVGFTNPMRWENEQFAIVGGYWNIGAIQDQQDWITGQIEDLTSLGKPTMLANHVQLPQTVDGPADIVTEDPVNGRPHAGGFTWDNAGSSWSNFWLGLGANYSAVKCMVQGHNHPWWDANKMIYQKPLGSRSVINVNLSANTYVHGGYGGSTKRWRQPVHRWYISFLDDGLQIRIRDHGLEGYLIPPGYATRAIPFHYVD